MAKKTGIARVAKGDIYEDCRGGLIEVTNGRLKAEGDNGCSFEGRSIEFNTQTGNANRSKTTDRFYLDELARKLSKADYAEWLEAGRREAEALADAEAPPTAASPQPASAAAKPKTPKPRKAQAPGKREGKVSALDAAAKVLAETREPMTAKALIEQMAAKGYWTSPGGATPHATLYAAMIREIANKGADARFAKTDRGLFAAADLPAPAPKAAKGKKPADGAPGPKSLSKLFKV